MSMLDEERQQEAERLRRPAPRRDPAPREEDFTDLPDPDDTVAMAKCREILATPSEYGYSDMGDFLFAYLLGKDSLAMFIWQCDVTYLGSKAPPPEGE